jgi:hypothetical protein
MPKSPAQIAREIREQARATLVDRVGVTEGAITTAWEPTIRRLRAQLRTASPVQAQFYIDQATRELANIAAQHIARGIEATTALGARAAAAQHTALTGPSGPIHDPAASRIPSSTGEQAQRTLAQARIQGSFARDRVPLSSRLYRNMDEVSHSAARVVRSSIEAREGVYRTAENFIAENRNSINVEVPRYTQDLIAAARRSLDTGDRSHLLDAIAEHARYMDNLGIGAGKRDGQTSLRTAVRQFVNDLQRATAKNIDKIVQRHLEDRAQYQARRIARSEMAEAHRQAYRASVDDQPYVMGLRWKMSPAHPKQDVCDLLANQDLHGLGPGGYPKDEYPDTPHAHCLCGPESITDPYFFRRQVAERDGLEAPPRPWESDTHATAEEWLLRQPTAAQREVLGPTRAAILADRSDPRRVITDRGIPIPVGQVTGANTSRAPTVTTPLSGLRR